MAVCFNRLASHIYEGAYKAGEQLTSGLFVEITANGVKKIAAAGDAEYRVEEKTNLWGLPAVRLVCVYEGSKEQYVTDLETENYGDKGDYNDAEYSIPAGHLVKMRLPEKNDMLTISVGDALYAALAEGDVVTPAAGGAVAKKS